MSKQSSASCVPPWRRRAFVLLEPEGLDRVERGRAVGWIKSETDADGRTDHQSRNRPAKGEDQISLEPGGQEIASDHAQNDADDSSNFRDENRFSEELPQNVATAGADRFTNTNFASV